MKGTITYVKTEKVEITVAEEDIRKALQLYLANYETYYHFDTGQVSMRKKREDY